jgi:hypothetical protein
LTQRCRDTQRTIAFAVLCDWLISGIFSASPRLCVKRFLADDKKIPLVGQARGTDRTASRAASHLPDHSAGIGTEACSQEQPGCRGFTGPVPPPLWIRVAIRLAETIARWAARVKFWAGVGSTSGPPELLAPNVGPRRCVRISRKVKQAASRHLAGQKVATYMARTGRYAAIVSTFLVDAEGVRGRR